MWGFCVWELLPDCLPGFEHFLPPCLWSGSSVFCCRPDHLTSTCLFVCLFVHNSLCRFRFLRNIKLMLTSTYFWHKISQRPVWMPSLWCMIPDIVRLKSSHISFEFQWYDKILPKNQMILLVISLLLLFFFLFFFFITIWWWLQNCCFILQINRILMLLRERDRKWGWESRGKKDQYTHKPTKCKWSEAKKETKQN